MSHWTSLFASVGSGGAALDFVDIITPPWLHREHCLRAAQAGVHIICQKPLCHRLEDAQAVVSELRDYHRLFLVHENHPYRPWFRDILQRHRAGFFGPLRFLHLMQHDAHRPLNCSRPKRNAASCSNTACTSWTWSARFSVDPNRVSARLQRINPRVRGDSLAHVVFGYRDTTAVLDISWKAHGLAQGSVLLVGEAGEAFLRGG